MSQVFRLVWPVAHVEVRPVPPGAAVDLRLDTLTHHILVAPELASEAAGLRLVREIFKSRIPDVLAGARQPLTLVLASAAGRGAEP